MFRGPNRHSLDHLARIVAKRGATSYKFIRVFLGIVFFGGHIRCSISQLGGICFAVPGTSFFGGTDFDGSRYCEIC